MTSPAPGFRDHFSRVAGAYATFRPHYPAALFAALAAQTRRRDIAWDCATGSGQAAVGLAEWFARVIATDASREQLGVASRHPRVRYACGLAEQAPLPSGAVDLVATAQSLHWFDVARFFAEARRVAAPGGLVVAWCYGLAAVDPAIDAVVGRFYRDTVGCYWPPQRALVDTGYRTVAFPFTEIALPSVAIEQQLTLDAFAGYVGTWSATQRYVAERGGDPVAALVAALAPLWGGGGTGSRTVRWPLAVRAGRA
jgi:SAM-dependent methyltransferase